MKGPWNIDNPLTDDGRNKINEMFQELYNEYREAGFNAKEARNKAEQAVVDALIAKETAEVTREEMLEIIREQTRNGDLAPEIAQARQGHETLGENLNSVKSQLAQTGAEVTNKKLTDNSSYIEPFHIETFDGSNEAYHPSVVYFSNPEGWNGYRFWMAYTPFPNANKAPYRDRWECPAILRSTDGNDWRKPFRAPNPLVDLTPEQIERGDWFSDPCIVMNGNTMEIWYRRTNGANHTETILYRISSTDGENWSSPEVVFDPLQSNNGFPGTMGMRSQQVFYDGTTFESFFSLQGGSAGELAYADTTEPSSGVWYNFTKLNMIDAPAGMNIWHIGVYKDNGVYHMIAYDRGNRALQYFVSTNKVDFVHVGTPVQTDSILTNLNALYQSVPVKIDDVWAIYVSGTFRNSFNDLKNGIALFYGRTLDNVTPVVPRQKYFRYFPSLINVYEEGKVARNYYGTYTDFNRDRFNGYGMKFGKGNDELNAPVWKQNTKNSPIVHVHDYNGRPTHVPEHIGMIYRDVTRNNELYISTGTESSNDWKKINVSMSVKRINASETISADGGEIIVIESGGTINYITGGVEGGEITLFNGSASGAITIKSNAGGLGEIRLSSLGDVTLRLYDTITLFKLNGRWYKK